MVLNNLGSVVRHQGDYTQARAYQEQSLQIRREIGDRRGEAMVLGNLGILCRRQGSYALARRYLEQTLPILRELGDQWSESRTLMNLGMILLDLGDYAGARVQLEKSRRMYGDIGDLTGEILSCQYLSRTLHCLEDDHAALKYALDTLPLARQVERGEVLIELGRALTGLGRLEEAVASYQQALEVSRELDMSAVATESLVGLVQVSLAGGEASQVQTCLEEILSYLESERLENLDEPFAVYLTCYRALQAAGDPRAGAILDAGHRLLQERATWIEDQALRNAYLENVAAHRELIAAYRQRRAAQTRHARLPRADAPTGRPLRADEYVLVVWTVAAPGDDEIPNKIARRRQRILRLLAEAQQQDAVPRDRDLAEALGVSLPTIRRDMAALCAEGHDLPTRGRR
jgi:tetratricopeptide (TPR) repeat protein